MRSVTTASRLPLLLHASAVTFWMPSDGACAVLWCRICIRGSHAPHVPHAQLTHFLLSPSLRTLAPSSFQGDDDARLVVWFAVLVFSICARPPQKNNRHTFPRFLSLPCFVFSCSENNLISSERWRLRLVVRGVVYWCWCCASSR